MTKTDIPVNCIDCPFRSLMFDRLTDDEMEIFNKEKKEKIYEKGEVIIREGQLTEEFVYLKTGLVKIHKIGMDEKDHIISISQPKDFISLLSVFSQKNYAFSVTAIEYSQVCSIKTSFLINIIKKNNDFAFDLLQKLSATYDNILLTRFKISSKHLRGRIAFIILHFARNVYENDRFELPLSRKEVAELINMTTENVIRILSEFRKDKIIDIDGKIIEILNFNLLKKICEVG